MKKGFTLIELLGTIAVLALILLIVIPIVNNIIEMSKKSATKDSLELYGRAVEAAIADYFVKNPLENTVTMKQLKDGNLIEYKGKDVECDTVQIVNRKVYLSDCKVGGDETNDEYGKFDPNPQLVDGLVPVEYTGDKWVVADIYSDTWYNYDDQKWANAVILLNTARKEIGDEVIIGGENPDALMMYVWIPRYEYKIGGTYGSQEQSREIEINFIPKGKDAKKGYKIHPAFKFGSDEISGIWVGKFELSHATKSTESMNCTSSNCIEAKELRILPGKSALRNNTVSSFFYGIKAIENIGLFELGNIDIHMIKNSEWGAAAYLSQSIYGKYGSVKYAGSNKEIYQNKSNSYLTGYSNGTPSQSTTNTQCAYDNETSNCGIGASTTGNIYGIYDMSGGASEYVMGAYAVGNNSTLDTLDSKYYDVYTSNEKDGHALSETNGWYSDNATMVTSDSPWFIRGGKYDDNNAGVFSYNSADDSGNNNYSTRVVCTVK